jgi:hypothetical protein
MQGSSNDVAMGHLREDPAMRHERGAMLGHGGRQDYAALSLKDLLDARDQYHVHLMRQPNVVATAIGYYRIRKEDTPPGVEPAHHGEGRRTLTNSEIRPYSWPAVLVIVAEWAEATEFGAGRTYDPDAIVPRTLYLPDGRRVPVCVIEAPRELAAEAAPAEVAYPLNNIGSGHPLLVTVQGRQHVATVGCLVTDGHRAYALTNRHVTGTAGEVVCSRLGGREREVGLASPLDESRASFSDLYPGWAGRSTFVNLDVGLVDVDRLDDWTARLKDGSVMGPMVDLSSTHFPLSLVGRKVKGWGAASGLVEGEVQGLFYRYKSRGGFEYVADLFIGPRSDDDARGFATRPGDSGTLWLMEPDLTEVVDGEEQASGWRPLALQWGANRLYSAMTAEPQAFALATCLSTVCERLDLDVVRDWNLDQPDTWGAVGHFSIAGRAADRLTDASATLRELMRNNAPIITRDDATILQSDFKGMGQAAFVPMADVPDFFWKHGQQGHSRPFEGPNHFADMDQPRPADGKTLLDLCADPAWIDPARWVQFYDSVQDLSTGQAITPEHRGLLPFRVWQIFDAMVAFATPAAGRISDEAIAKFVCAAGVLAHYVGDACQPLHISYLHDGDPLQGHSHTVHHHDGTTSDVTVAKGVGVHSAYEDAMVNSHRQEILDGLDQTPAVTDADVVTTGEQAAAATIAMMRTTFAQIPPADLVAAYVALPDKRSAGDALWTDFGPATIQVMQAGVRLLAALWESAWRQAGAEGAQVSTAALSPSQAMDVCSEADFLPSCSVAQVGDHLS